MRMRPASLRWPAILLGGAAGLSFAGSRVWAWTTVPDVALGLMLAALLVAGGAGLGLWFPRPVDPVRRRLIGLAASIVGMVGVLCGAVTASEVADTWPQTVRTLAVAAAIFGLLLLAGGSAMVRQAEQALRFGVDPRSRSRDRHP